METVWFCLVAFMFAMYVVLDGFDLGAGAVQRLVARTAEERHLVLRSIGPVWDGNEVWLLAAGGALFLAFPPLYAASFSGFYLPLMMVLWLVILRGLAIEFRGQIDLPMWKDAWDVVFSASSALLAVFLGVALGNVVRGVPLNDEGWFFTPLWTDLSIGPRPGILDWYTVPVGIAALVALALHGALWVAIKTAGEVERRANDLAQRLWWAVLATTALVTLLTLWVQPQLWRRLSSQPWGFVFVLAALGGLAAVRLCLLRGNVAAAFLSSCAYLLGMLASAAFGLYPYLLPATTDPGHALTVHDAASSAHGLRVALAWWIPGMLLVTGYFVHVYRNFRGKLSDESDGHY